jgi:DNA-binding beta-propeller fold protein YncE
MARAALRVALAGRRYRIERPWGDIPLGRALVSDVTCDARGHVFVLLRHDAYLDPDLPAVIELSPEGVRLSAWGGAEIADGHMLACGLDGRIYVVDRDAHEIVVFDASGRHVGGLGSRHVPDAPFNHPAGVAVAANGEVYVADGYGAARVHRFGPDGRLIATWGEGGTGPGQFSTPHGIFVLRDGRVLVTDRENDRVQVFDATGAFLGAWGGFARPMDVFEDDAGGILITDQVPRLALHAPDGVRRALCRPVLNGAHGIWGDGAGRLYLAELSPSRLTRLVPEPG